MKKNILLLFAGCILTKGMLAQTTDPGSGKQPPQAMSNAMGLGLSFPVGGFARTHTAGVTLDYSYSTRRYGNDALADKLISFAINAAVSYNVGKSAATAGYESRYGGLFILYAAAGIDCKPSIPVNIALNAGPLMSIYKGSADAGFGANLFWNYFVSKKIAVGPGISYRTYSKTDALWSWAIRACYAF